METIASNFWKHVQIGGFDECWPWNRSTTAGYGAFRHQRRLILSHRHVFEIVRGPIPSGLFVCHKCDNKLCCNPLHYFSGTQKDNMQDAFKKGILKLPPIEKRPRGKQNGATKIDEEKVILIRRLYAEGGETFRSLGRKFNLAYSHVGLIIKKKRWVYV